MTLRAISPAAQEQWETVPLDEQGGSSCLFKKMELEDEDWKHLSAKVEQSISLEEGKGTKT